MGELVKLTLAHYDIGAITDASAAIVYHYSRQLIPGTKNWPSLLDRLHSNIRDQILTGIESFDKRSQQPDPYPLIAQGLTMAFYGRQHLIDTSALHSAKNAQDKQLKTYEVEDPYFLVYDATAPLAPALRQHIKLENFNALNMIQERLPVHVALENPAKIVFAKGSFGHVSVFTETRENLGI